LSKVREIFDGVCVCEKCTPRRIRYWREILSFVVGKQKKVFEKALSNVNPETST